MSLDIAALVAPLSDDAPSGPDLSYEAGRQQIESVFERSISAEEGGGEEPDWRGTIAAILAEAETTRDLWLATYLMRAAAKVGQFDLLTDASELFAALLEERWPDVHPQLDEVGFLGRKTPCEPLTRIGEFLAPLSRVVLIEHPRFGRFSGADFERFREEGDSADGYGPFRATLEATDQEQLSAIVDRLDAMRQAIRRADAVMTGNADGDTATNFQPTYDAIEKIRRSVASFLPSSGDENAGGDDGTSSADGYDDAGYDAPNDGDSVGGGGSVGGPIRSRNDVIRALDSISAYYAKYEPASPVPFALRRAREWISLDFLAVLEDIAPESLDSARRVLMSARGNSGNDYGSASSSSGDDDSGWGTSSSSDDGWSS